jgi:DNA repair protein RadA/Sms
MVKTKRRYVCQACGSLSHRWQGQCADCAEWNTLVEEAPATVFSMKHDLSAGGRTVAFEALDAPGEVLVRRRTGLAEFDRALGGGLVPGSAVLMGGDPGIGKSTLLLQSAAAIARTGAPVVYVSGEEAAGQVRLRASRLGLADAPIKLAAASSVRDILTSLHAMPPPALLVIDSIQTMHSDTIEGAPGTVSQVRGCAFELIRYAKENGVALVLVGHVTKDGSIAGPRVLEHLVDVVLHFEGDRNSRFRMLRAMKNRYGPVDEVGCFDLSSEGIQAVTDPTGLFVEHHTQDVSGTCVAVTMEGRRPLLAEVQALLTPSPLERPRRTVSGVESSRVDMVLAVLQRHARLRIAGSDTFVATVGGAKLHDPAADLAIAVAVASSHLGVPAPRGAVAIGEIGLAGELRRVRDLPQRIAEAARLGFKVAVVPRGRTLASERGIPSRRTVDGLRVIEVDDVFGALLTLELTPPL